MIQPDATEAPEDARGSLAAADEQRALQEAVQAATLQHLSQRVVALNVEVRVRDERIAALEAELAACSPEQDIA